MNDSPHLHGGGVTLILPAGTGNIAGFLYSLGNPPRSRQRRPSDPVRDGDGEFASLERKRRGAPSLVEGAPQSLYFVLFCWVVGLVDAALSGPANGAALKVHVVHAVCVGLIAACCTVTDRVACPMVVDCAVTVGLVGTVCVRPEQHLCRRRSAPERPWSWRSHRSPGIPRHRGFPGSGSRTPRRYSDGGCRSFRSR